MNDVPIDFNELIEFEFEEEGFSIFYDPKEKMWVLETEGDEDDMIHIIIEDFNTSFDFHEDELAEYGVTKEMFLNMKKAVGV